MAQKMVRSHDNLAYKVADYRQGDGFKSQ